MSHSKSGPCTSEIDDSFDWELGSDRLEKPDLRAGVSSWEALYHFVDAKMATELFELDLAGYGDESLIDPSWLPGEREAFQTGAFRLRRLMMDLDCLLWRKLRLGELVAFGYSNLASLDAARREILPERWEVLELDLKASSANRPGIEITQILIFSTEPGPRDVADSARLAYSAANLRRWYLKRIDSLRDSGPRPSREQDYRDANADFEGKVPKRAVEALRRELAPSRWTLGGRPRKSKSL